MTVAALGLVTTASSAALAQPAVTEVRFAAADVRLVGADGAQWRLALQASASGAAHTETPTSGSGQELVVTAQRCAADRCANAGSWRVGLTDDEIEVAADYSTATVTTSLFGRTLELRLAPTGAQTGTAQVTVGRPSQRGESYATAGRVVQAAGTVTVAGVTCAPDEAVIGEDARVEEPLDAPGRTATAPRGLLRGSAAPRCA